MDAEGVIATDGSYVTPIMSSPVHPEEPIVGDAIDGGESTGDRLAEVGTLIPIEELEEVPDSESDEVPEENEEPLQVREQPPAYSPVCGQRAMCGGHVSGPHNFRRHCFPYTANSDQQPSSTYFQWEIASSKCRRAEDNSGGKNDCQEPILLTILKLYFSAQLSHFLSFKSLFS